ncbi:MAG: 50S ribosomal protein L13 [Elusimicrobiota bacterium]
MSSTFFPKKDRQTHQWHLVDAKGQVLGRLATRVAGLLRGKGKPTFTPYLDEGDGVIVFNASKVRLTGNKIEQKVAYSHSLYPGGLKLVPYTRLMKENPERVIVRAVSGMLSKSKLRDRMLTRLKVYAGAEHPHASQQPQLLTLS